MSLVLDWKQRTVDGVTFSSSVTDREIAVLRELARNGTVLEIGTAYGYATAQMAQVATHVTTIDPHEGYGSMGDSERVARAKIEHLGLTEKVTMLVGSSQDLMPMMRVNPDKRFDLAFIDGDHRYAAVKADMELAGLLVKPGGYMAVHDYGEATCPDVQRCIDDNYNGNLELEIVDTLWLARKPQVLR